jgi:hypothetical protein
MKRSLFLVAAVLLLCLVANAQQPVTPDDGVVKDGVYSNRYFHFSVAYPADWVVHGDATNTQLKEVAKERATSSGALSSASSEVILKNTYQLLTAFQYPLGTPGVELNSGFMIVAENVSHAPGIVSGRDYVITTRPLMLKLGAQPVQDEPDALVLSGRKFFRQDYVTEVGGLAVRQTTIITIIKGFALGFIMTGKDPQVVNEAAKALDTLKFNDSPVASSPKPTGTTSRTKTKSRRRP